MMDNEFDSLSEDIDQYSQDMKCKMEKGNYNVSIDSKSLEEYVLLKFQNTSIVRTLSKVVVDDEIVEELTRFGFKTIEDIEEILTEDMLNKLEVNKK